MTFSLAAVHAALAHHPIQSRHPVKMGREGRSKCPEERTVCPEHLGCSPGLEPWQRGGEGGCPDGPRQPEVMSTEVQMPLVPVVFWKPRLISRLARAGNAEGWVTQADTGRGEPTWSQWASHGSIFQVLKSLCWFSLTGSKKQTSVLDLMDRGLLSKSK